MSKYGTKLIFDCGTGETREEELTDQEKIDFDLREIEHEKLQQEYAKVKYLEDRKNDLNWPTDSERLEALTAYVGGNPTKINELNARIAEIEAKYPQPIVD